MCQNEIVRNSSNASMHVSKSVSETIAALSEKDAALFSLHVEEAKRLAEAHRENRGRFGVFVVLMRALGDDRDDDKLHFGVNSPCSSENVGDRFRYHCSFDFNKHANAQYLWITE